MRQCRTTAAVIGPLLLAASGISTPDARAARFYECRTPDGSTSFQSQPCSGAMEEVRRGHVGERGVVEKQAVPDRKTPDDAQVPGDATSTDHAETGDDASQTTTSSAMAEPLGPYRGSPEIVNVYPKQSRLTQVFSRLYTVMMYRGEQYSYHDRWPDTLHAMGIEPASFSTANIERVRLLPGGRIVVELVPFFGDDKKIALTPTSEVDGTAEHWDCAINYPERFVKRITGDLNISDCRSRSIP